MSPLSSGKSELIGWSGHEIVQSGQPDTLTMPANQTARPTIGQSISNPTVTHALKSIKAVLALALGRPVDLIDLELAGQPILNQILKHG